MQCPIDGAELVMTDRQGVEIDYCPKCRGVWLDRGELDKVLERSAAQPQGYGRRDDDDDDRYERRDDRVDVRPSSGGMIGKIGGTMARMGDRDDRRRDDDDVRYDRQGRPRKKKRESFLDDLFDF